MAAALWAQPSELLALVLLSPIADEIGVWVVGRPWLPPLATRDRETLLRQVPTREMVREIGGAAQDQRSIVEANHDDRSAAGTTGEPNMALIILRRRRDRRESLTYSGRRGARARRSTDGSRRTWLLSAARCPMRHAQ